MPKHNQEVGKWGEKIALDYLQNKRYTLIDRNVRNEIGEIDLIMKLDEIIIFIEVKTRTNLNYGFPEEAISAGKYQRMFDSASLYLAVNFPAWEGDWHLELISIVGEFKSNYPEIVHLDSL